MLDKCRNCGFEADPCVNESHAGVCPRCGQPEDEKPEPVWRAIESGNWSEPARVAKHVKRNFGELCDEYRSWAKVNLRSYENYVKVGLKFWGREAGRGTALEKITTQWIESIKSTYVVTVEQATVDRKLEVLRAMFNWGVESGLISAVNPMRGVKLFKPNNELVRYLSNDEYVSLLQAANHQRWHVRPILELAANTGLRKKKHSPTALGRV